MHQKSRTLSQRRVRPTVVFLLLSLVILSGCSLWQFIRLRAEKEAQVPYDIEVQADRLAAALLQNCGRGETWIYGFEPKRADADRCVMEALQAQVPFRVHYIYYDIDSQLHEIFVTTAAGERMLLTQWRGYDDKPRVDFTPCPHPRIMPGDVAEHIVCE